MLRLYPLLSVPDFLLSPLQADKPSAPPPAPVPTTVPVTPKPTTTAVATVDPATSKPAAATNATPTDDAELERRKKRAERFGIPLVEPTKQKARPENKAANGTPKQTVSSDVRHALVPTTFFLQL